MHLSPMYVCVCVFYLSYALRQVSSHGEPVHTAPEKKNSLCF